MDVIYLLRKELKIYGTLSYAYTNDNAHGFYSSNQAYGQVLNAVQTSTESTILSIVRSLEKVGPIG